MCESIRALAMADPCGWGWWKTEKWRTQVEYRDSTTCVFTSLKLSKIWTIAYLEKQNLQAAGGKELHNGTFSPGISSRWLRCCTARSTGSPGQATTQASGWSGGKAMGKGAGKVPKSNPLHSQLTPKLTHAWQVSGYWTLASPAFNIYLHKICISFQRAAEVL